MSFGFTRNIHRSSHAVPQNPFLVVPGCRSNQPLILVQQDTTKHCSKTFHAPRAGLGTSQHSSASVNGMVNADRGPKDYINTGISHSASKGQYKGDARNAVL